MVPCPYAFNYYDEIIYKVLPYILEASLNPGGQGSAEGKPQFMLLGPTRDHSGGPAFLTLKGNNSNLCLSDC